MDYQFAKKDMEQVLESLESYNEIIKKMLDNDSVGNPKLVKHKYVIQINEIFTIGQHVQNLNEKKLNIMNTCFPDMFSSEDADKVIEMVTCTNGFGVTIVPKKVYWRDWYTQRLWNNDSAISSIKKVLGVEGYVV